MRKGQSLGPGSAGMAVPTPKLLGIASIALGALVYLGAVAGVFFAEATPPLDSGAVSYLVTAVLFGVGALAVARLPA